VKAYWIKFETTAAFRFERDGGVVVKRAVPSPFNLGIGVTARDEADAIYLAQVVVGKREVESISPVIDPSTLDQGHVRPNMGDIFVRGVWWPRGFEGVGHRVAGLGCLVPFHAIIDVEDPGGVHKRATIDARDLADAKARLEAEYGGTVISLWVDPEFQSPCRV
jgi:hypothetical protein